MNTLCHIVFALTLLLPDGFGVEVQWSTSQLGGCKANDTMHGLCTKSRTVYCVKKSDGQTIPDYYCNNSADLRKPASHVPCDVKDCPQRCIVTTWSAWNPCDPACSVTFRYRTRSVVWRGQGSAACPPLIEKAPCAHCTKRANKDLYYWQVGKWGTCRHFKTVTVYKTASNSTQSTDGNPSAQNFCGTQLKLGKSTRKVRCVDNKGKEVRARKCLNSKDKYGRITQKPDKMKVCRLPCDCSLSGWSQWSGCPKDCSQSEERRTRDVLYAPQMGGKPCGKLEERRACDTRMCERYEWYPTAWHSCQTQNIPGSSKKSDCGPGFQERLVFCIKAGDTKDINIKPVQDSRCNHSIKLASKQPCHVRCSEDCKVGRWQAWEPCSAPCGRTGIKKRRRRILRKARNGGMECPNLVEMSPCAPVLCYSWKVRPWSPCFVAGKCGSQGRNARHVYCAGFNYTYEPNQKCSRVPKPPATRSCVVPCPSDCAVSHWGEWGQCSKSCGINGGIQTRHRRILAYPSANRAPCPVAKDLVEQRICNQYTHCGSEENFMWKTGNWSKCEPLANGLCGFFKGIKKRSVYCGTHMQLVNNSFCRSEVKPSSVSPCNISCPTDCILSQWQEWSTCNQTCGSTGTQVRKRFILQQPSNGGVGCLLNMTDGVQEESQKCGRVIPCYNYTWTVSQWKECHLLRQSKSVPYSCGAGYQIRNISCLRSDKKIVETSFCFKSLLEPPPSGLQECWKPCPNYCVRTSWSAWSSCPNICQHKSRRYRLRTRQVVNLSPARGGWSTTCPQLTSIDYYEKELCPPLKCLSYKWHEGPWGSCVLNEMSACGKGRKEKTVLCQRSDNMYVSDTYCNNETKPILGKSCHINCTQDCSVSPWGQWSNCSDLCGDNIQRRYRTVIKSPFGLGRKCPNLVDKQLCHEPACTLFRWSVDLWTTCKLSTNHSNCGNGTQTRKVICIPDPSREEICLRQAPKPATFQHCNLACPGDCVLNNWGPWSNCVRGKDGCIRKRWRKYVRKSSATSKKKCSDEPTQERQPCDCPTTGKLVFTEWSSCQFNYTNGPNCGKGQQFRSFKCVDTKGKVLTYDMCKQINKPVTTQDCDVKCPVDCVLGEWSHWSHCSRDCGTDGVMIRTKPIIVSGSNGGRKCPDVSGLVQKRPCNGKACYTYTLHIGKWSKCYVDGQGCGQGSRSRETTCRRSDGLSVPFHYCFEQLKRYSSVVKLPNLDVLWAVLNNISKLSILTKRDCVQPCPGNCVQSEWSDWSLCGKNCFENTAQTFQWRTRVIISKPIAGGKACSPELSQMRKCQPSGDDKCLGAEWKVGLWQRNGTREVWCQTSYGLNVTGACAPEKKPHTTNICDPKCSGPSTICRDGECICKPQFELFQSQCIPYNGCLHDKHCIHKNTVCLKQKCVCRKGHLHNRTTDPSILSEETDLPTLAATEEITMLSSSKETVTVSVTDTVVTSGPSHTTADDVRKEALHKDEGQGYWKWIGIGVGALVLFILVAVAIFLYTRKHMRGNNKQLSETHHLIELIGAKSIKEPDAVQPLTPKNGGNPLPVKV